MFSVEKVSRGFVSSYLWLILLCKYIKSDGERSDCSTEVPAATLAFVDNHLLSALLVN